MRKVYVAGRYSAEDVISGLENIRRGMRVATEILLKGNAVFCPWLDHQLFFQLQDNEKISSELIQAHSMAWLEASDLVYVLKDSEFSKGTKAEVKRAKDLGIPIYYEDEKSWLLLESI